MSFHLGIASGVVLLVANVGGESYCAVIEQHLGRNGNCDVPLSLIHILTYRFIRDEHGIATQIIEGHVSGDYKYERQK